MIEVRIEHVEAGTMTGRCFFCGERQNTPETVVAAVSVDSESDHGLACPECLALSDSALRAEMVAFAERLEAWAADMRAASSRPIRRPPAGVLELERLHALPAPVFIDSIGG